jgi:hypothetical protein
MVTPANWPIEFFGERAEQHLFGVGVNFGAESTAHVRGDDPEVAVFATVGSDECSLGALRVLRGDPLGEATFVPYGSRCADFEWARRHALVHEAAGDDNFAVLEKLVGVAVLGKAERSRVEHGVAAGCVVNKRLGSERAF